jgi:hypothetical protein
VLNLYAPVEYIIYIKLVSPIICVGHSTTKIIYRKRLNPISLSVVRWRYYRPRAACRVLGEGGLGCGPLVHVLLDSAVSFGFHCDSSFL